MPRHPFVLRLSYNIDRTERKDDRMRIILDDHRPLPEDGPYNCVRSYSECIFLLRNFHTIRYISLDYDLDEEETGLDVLKYMVENGNEVQHLNIHSTHSYGVPIMEEYARQHFPNTKITLRHL